MANITVLSDVIVPNSIISAGVRGKQMRLNRRTRVENGEMQIIPVWSRTLRQYEIGIVPLTVSQWQALEGLFEVTDAGAYGMLMQDPKDCSASDATGKVTLVDAGTHTYQLIKHYASTGSSRTKDRVITRPRALGFILKISGTPTGSYTLNADAGTIVIPSDPAAADVTWSSLFYVPVHFASDEIDWELVVAGPEAGRLMTGPSLTLMEVRE